MSAKKIFYVSASLLMLMLAYALGTQRAAAELVGDPNEYGPVVAGITDNGAHYYLRSDGTAWQFEHDTPWRLMSGIPTLPMPVSQIAIWAPSQFVTKDGYVWLVGATGEWGQGAQIPLPIVQTDGKTWGSMKQEYRKLH